MSKVLVSAKKKINPYEAGKIALVTAAYLLVTIVDVILWHQGLTFEGLTENNIWMVGAVFAACGQLAFTGIIGHQLYKHLDTKSRYWDAYSD